MNAPDSVLRPFGERRVAVRYPVQVLESPVTCRVNPGHEVKLANLAAVGALVEAAFPLLPGRPVQVHLQALRRRAVIEARVVRCAVTAVTAMRGMRFAAGLAFARWVDLTMELELQVGARVVPE